MTNWTRRSDGGIQNSGLNHKYRNQCERQPDPRLPGALHHPESHLLDVTMPAGAIYNITAVYNGDAAFAGSTSAVFAQRVIYITTISKTTSANPEPFGQFLSLTVTVNSAGSGITGYITFLDGVVPITTAGIGGNTRVFTFSSLSKGTHSIVAV